MTMIVDRKLLAIVWVLVVLLAASSAAVAQEDLASAKGEGLVGERPDGLVAIVTDDPSPDLRELVEQVNGQRMDEYRQIAEETDAPLEAVQVRAGTQIIERLPSGQYFMDAAGRWRQK
jgi:uncharacterized protein